MEERFNLYPIKYHDIWEHYKAEKAIRWDVNNIVPRLKEDKKDIVSLKGNMKILFERTLALFAVIDSVVNSNNKSNYLSFFQSPEVECLLSYQMFIECVHQETYNEFIKVYFDDISKQRKLFNSIKNEATVKEMCEWMLANTNENELAFLSNDMKKILLRSKIKEVVKQVKSNTKATVSKQLFISALSEGVGINGSFMFIFYLRSLGLFPMFTKANEYIFKDELTHQEAFAILYKHVDYTLDQEVVYPLVEQFIALWKKFYSCMGEGFIGFKYVDLVKHLEWRADVVLADFGFPPLYKSQSPFPYKNIQEITVRSTSRFNSLGTEYGEKDMTSADLSLSFEDW